MAVIYAGIDEAGYGPMLGPLCVALSVFHVEQWSPGEPAPDLWRALSNAVCKATATAKVKASKIAVGDSKKLKLPNDAPAEKGRHPLMHLERGLLSFLSCAPGATRPATDSELFARLGCDLESGGECYRGAHQALPVAWRAEQLAIAGNMLASAMSAGGVKMLDAACITVCEERFNETVQRTGSKAEVTAEAVGAHLRRVLAAHAASGQPIRLVCDRLGGRTDYAEFLERHTGASGVDVLEESPRCSRYRLDMGETGGGGSDVSVLFMPECESSHLPVALASMCAKFVRELAMGRFNRHWREAAAASGCEIKPTAGYTQDARRWLDDASRLGLITAELRRRLVRLA